MTGKCLSGCTFIMILFSVKSIFTVENMEHINIHGLTFHKNAKRGAYKYDILKNKAICSQKKTDANLFTII